MPKRDDIRSVLVIGSGPIVIGQACEFDYSGTQGAKALRAAGYEIILVNSNPAAIMTDPEAADRALRDRGIIARKMAGYQLPAALRITVGDAAACAAVAEAIGDFVRARV